MVRPAKIGGVNQLVQAVNVLIILDAIEMNVIDLARGSVTLPVHDEMFHHRDVIGMTGIVIVEATAMTIKKSQRDTEGTGTTVTWIENLRLTILAAGGTTESVMNV
jgi:hypothetical protein